MSFDEFVEALVQTKEIIDWRLMVLRPDNPHSNGIIDGVGTDRTIQNPQMGVIYEGIKDKYFSPISAVYYLKTGKYINPPNYFYARLSVNGQMVFPHVDKELGIDRAFGHRVAVASFNWSDSPNFVEGDRPQLLKALGLEEHVYKAKSRKKEDDSSGSPEAFE